MLGGKEKSAGVPLVFGPSGERNTAVEAFAWTCFMQPSRRKNAKNACFFFKTSRMEGKRLILEASNEICSDLISSVTSFSLQKVLGNAKR